ncbi:hypothetical protein HYU95_03865 [Candidatus Daviesbacteria bacterium]|nr:hypothetical protein [Candidatus Daviesbacteria bacterium]
MSQIEGLRYPQKLVHKYGAKAGLLMQVARCLPEIPQMPMVVSEIGEQPGDFLARVDKDGIPWPRIFRSSATVELCGYEGIFTTCVVDTFKGQDGIARYFNVDGNYKLLKDDKEFNQRLEDLVRGIAHPQDERSLPEADRDYFPSEINVITAPLAPCKYTGTLIKHPNRPDLYLTTIADSNKSKKEGKLTLQYNPRGRFYIFGSIYRNIIRLDDVPEDELKTVTGWHDAIAKILDPRWVYVIEYGLMPATLFQVHYFKPIHRPDFRFDCRQVGPSMPIVIGVTDKKGQDFEVVFEFTRQFETDLPVLYVCDLHNGFWDCFREDTEKEPQGYVFTDGGGILAHRDVKALRKSKLALIYPDGIGPRGLNREGMVVNVVSNGREVRIKDKVTGEEIS